MILAKREDAGRYRGIHPALDRALALLTDDFLRTVTPEVLRLDGDALYVSRCDYTTLPEQDTFFEAHRRYLDIHVLLSGEERVDIARPDTLELFEHRDDFFAYRGQAEQSVILRSDNFLVVFPGDAHRIKIQTDGPCAVSKAVFKILPD